ncbi:formate transporter FocA [Shewanella mesophila]|nr:formate transporter FocA [Shewanella mesophila]
MAPPSFNSAVSALQNQADRVPIQPASTALSMYQQAERYGVTKVKKAYWQSLGLAAFAGAFIALAFVFYITVTTGSSSSWGLVRLAGGLAFSLGLMLVVICGGELFTSTVLSSVAWAQKLVSTKELLACWVRVYIGNLFGAMLMLTLIITARMYELDGGLWGVNALNIAQHKLHHGWAQAFALGVLCNMLVCLGVWMTFASKDALTKAILLMLPVAMFVSSGFEHSIANLFMVPLGIVIANFAHSGYFDAAGITAAQYSDLTLANFIWNNLIPVTLGNIVGGGLLVGLGYWIIERKPQQTSDLHIAPPTLAECLSPFNSPSIQSLTNTVNGTHSLLVTPSGDVSMPKSIQKLNVSEVMNQTPFTLTPELSVYEGLKRLSDANERGASVVDAQQRLLGYISQQDLLRSLWSEEYVRGIAYKVADLMQTQVLTVAPNDAVADLIELMVVDRNKLFPVSEMGILTGNTFASYEERLRRAHASKPSSFPVVDEGKLVGVITREAIAAKVCDVYA